MFCITHKMIYDFVDGQHSNSVALYFSVKTCNGRYEHSLAKMHPRSQGREKALGTRMAKMPKGHFVQVASNPLWMIWSWTSKISSGSITYSVCTTVPA